MFLELIGRRNPCRAVIGVLNKQRPIAKWVEMDIKRLTSDKGLSKNSLVGTSVHQLLVGLVLVFSKAALSDELLDINKAPVTIPLGGFQFAPVLEVSETYNDNIFRKNLLKRGSFLTQVHGGGELSYRKNRNRYGLTYAMQSMSFHESAADSYVDQYVGMNTHSEFTSRNLLDFDLKYLKSHYQRGVFLGTDIASPLPQTPTPEAYHQYTLASQYQYGHANAKGNLRLTLNVDDYTFDNYFSNTVGYDRTQYAVTPGFYYRMLPNTQLSAEVENKWANYKNNSWTSIDNNKQRFLVGGNWAYSTKLKARTRVGYVRLQLDNPNLKGFDDVTWDMGIQWTPKPYSQVMVDVTHDPIVSVGYINGNIRTSDRFKLGWKHNWTPRITSELTGSFENAYNTTLVRKDDYSSLGVEMNYGVQRWLGVGVSYTYNGLQSTNQTFIYDQNLFMVYVTGNPRISDEVKSPWATWY